MEILGGNILEAGGLKARLASGTADRAAILALREQGFPHRGGGHEQWEPYDSLCRQLVVCGPAGPAGGRSGAGREGPGSPKGTEAAGAAGGPVMASLRLLVAPVATVAEEGYAARFYDLAPLRGYPRPVAEIGRLCLAPGPRAWEALRLLLGALARLVDDGGAGLMLGCASFPGADWRGHRRSLALLAAGHLGPAPLMPRRRAAETVDYPRLAGPPGAGATPAERRAALAGLPPLLRSYLAMGGWVSDHAVADRELDTLHVFTCVSVDGVPAARAARLRRLAAQGLGGG